MKRILCCLISFWSAFALALPCDCEVWVFPAMTGSHQRKPTILKSYTLEEYGTYAFSHQRECRQNCLSTFLSDMPHLRLNALLLTYSERLINQGLLGYNCTGLTTLKYPIKVKARLGDLGLGNVEDRIQVINHEEPCFNP